MSPIRGMAVGIIAVALMSSGWAEGKKEDPAKLLIGKWEVTKSEKELPVGSVIEFAKDGVMTITRKGKDGKMESLEATYKVMGDKLQHRLKGSDSEKDPLTIKAVSGEQLVLLVPAKNRTWEFKRIK